MKDKEAEFMSGWENPSVVNERLGPALSLYLSSLQNGPAKDDPPAKDVEIVSSTVSPLEGHSGLSGDMARLEIVYKTTEETQRVWLVLKRTRASERAREQSKRLGLFREGSFYSGMAPLLREKLGSGKGEEEEEEFLPEVLYAACDPSSGQKAIVMAEYSRAAEAGAFFPHSVHNVARRDRIAGMLRGFEEVTPTSITLQAAKLAAALHGCFYRDAALLGDRWPHLRMAAWLCRKDRASFISTQTEARRRWEQAQARYAAGTFFGGSLVMHDALRDVVDASMRRCLDFDAFVDAMTSQPHKRAWSLVHGDYHPGNMLVLNPPPHSPNHHPPRPPRLLLLDWEVVGVGSGPQDIGQFLISHLDPQHSCPMVPDVAAVYRDKLVQTLLRNGKQVIHGTDHHDHHSDDDNSTHKVIVPSLQNIQKEIIYGGLERWIWLLAFMSDMDMPPFYFQYFCDQVYGWIQGHNILVNDVGMPRP